MSAIKKEVVIGNCRLLLGDCLEIMPELGEFDAVITDPPYDFETSGGGIFRKNRTNMDEIASANLDNGFDFEAFKSEQFGAVVFFCHNDQLSDLLSYVSQHWDKHVLCSWIKSNPMPVANKHYQPDTEFWIHAWNKSYHPCGELSEKKRYYFGKGGKDTSIKHPTVKPMPLMQKITTNVGNDFILDPFMGSGTTGIACQKSGQHFTGIEINPEYFEIACKRIQDAYDRPDLFIEQPKQEPEIQEALL